MALRTGVYFISGLVAAPVRVRARASLEMEFPVLDVVFVAGILALIALVALIARAVERL